MKTKRLKKEIRVIGIDDASFNRTDKEVLVIATYFRGGDFIDGILSTIIKKDGTDSTRKIINMINKCKFKSTLKCLLLDGIALGGFNIIDVNKLHKETKLPIIVVIRNYPDYKKIFSALKKIKMENKIKLIEKAGKVTKLGKIYVQLTGLSLERAKEIIAITATHSYIPEPIRIAHLIGTGIKKGESKGRA